ncbi:hypothetical protein KJ654_04720 [Patescibacteria group bacterium]|nr:hypothetical protein [Patescibacteria group bacterium]
MLTAKGFFNGEKIELLEPVPTRKKSLVTVLFFESGKRELQDEKEAIILSNSPIFKGLIARAMEEIKKGSTRPIEELLDEL